MPRQAVTAVAAVGGLVAAGVVGYALGNSAVPLALSATRAVPSASASVGSATPSASSTVPVFAAGGTAPGGASATATPSSTAPATAPVTGGATEQPADVPSGSGADPAGGAEAPTDEVLETDFTTNQVNGPGIAVYGAYQARLAVQQLVRLTWDEGMAGSHVTDAVAISPDDLAPWTSVMTPAAEAKLDRLVASYNAGAAGARGRLFPTVSANVPGEYGMGVRPRAKSFVTDRSVGSARVDTVAGHGDQVRISFPTTVDYHFVLGERTLTYTTERQSSYVMSRASGRWLIVDWRNTDKVISMVDSGAAVQVPVRSS